MGIVIIIITFCVVNNMNYRRIIETYHCDIRNLVEILERLINSYRLLIGGAGELNSIALTKKKDVKDALKRANELGHIIDDVIKSLECTSYGYMDYCRIKSDFISAKLSIQYIETEIDEELKLKD